MPDAPPLHPKEIRTPGGTFPLHEFHLATAGREWTFLHGGVILTRKDEDEYLHGQSKYIPYGLALWPSSIALAYEIAARNPASFAGKRILELGAGTGLPGIVAATLGADVTQSDRQDVALMLCKANGRRNNVEPSVTYTIVDWTAFPDDGQRYDYILGSDILYGESLHPHITDIFQSRLTPAGRILLSDPFRASSMRFLEARQEEGWTVTASRWNLGDDTDPRTIGVFELAR